ncbi:MAG: hypothetical protein FWC91_07105 [Defluviitaleaceae bacterium]|nr:hypothetical protein [Defluviitaleaceae bacterium]
MEITENMKTTEKIACVPTAGDYGIITDMLIQRCLGYKTMPCPPMTKRTLELGARYSPDMICTPFKISLGNFIEAAENGANVIIMLGIVCRLGFFDILQKQILDDLGYDCEMLILFDYLPTVSGEFPTINNMYECLRAINPDLTKEKFYSIFEIMAKVTFDKDYLADFMRRNIAFEVHKGEYEKHYNDYLQEAGNVQSVIEAEEIFAKYKEKIESVAINKPEKPIQIGIIGEIYVVIEPFANCNIEKWLAKRKVEIIRPSDWSSTGVAIWSLPELIKNSGGYVNYNIGSTANDVIAQAHQMMKGGIDGIIHVKPASCSPEITGMSILQNMSRDYNIPIMYLTFDTGTSETGVHTRLEAFYDMVTMKRERD